MTTEPKHIVYYTLEPFTEPPPPTRVQVRFASAAVMSCMTCGVVVAGMGGPGQAVCKKCHDVLVSGQASGCIKWKDDGNG